MKQYSILLLLYIIWQQQSSAQTINADNLNRLITFCDSTKADEVLLSHKGKTVARWKRTDFSALQRDTAIWECGTAYMYTASMVKSWTGLVIGILIDKGLINQVDDPVCKYIPEWKAGCENKITIRHLLTMTAGINKRPGAESILAHEDMNRYVLNLQPDTLPGIRFRYSNESVQLLGIIMERVTGKKADAVFDEYLFRPMKMDSSSLAKDAVGNVVVYGGCTTTVDNACKIGMLMRNQGLFEDQRIVSEQWVNESITPSPLAPYYGYLWWIDKSSKYWNYAATGDLGQMTIIFPDLDLIFIRRQSCDLSAASSRMSWMGPKFLELISGVVSE